MKLEDNMNYNLVLILGNYNFASKFYEITILPLYSSEIMISLF